MIRPISNSNPLKGTSPDTGKKTDIGLKLGAIIKGKVSQTLKNGEFIIASGGKSFKASSSTPLKNGVRYDFLVTSADKKIELKVLGVKHKGMGNILKLFSSANSIGRKLTGSLSEVVTALSHHKNSPAATSKLMGNLQKLINLPVFKKDITEIVTWVNKNIQGSGIFWENKVLQLLTGKKGQVPKEMVESDLKGILLGLMKSLEKSKGNPEELKILTAKIKDAVNLIEQEQHMNISTIREGIGWFVHLPFINDEDFNASELFIKKDKEEGVHFSIFLDMSFAGKMEMNVSLVNEILGIHINVENRQTEKAIKENIKELEDAFSGMGIKTGSISCEIRENITPADQAEENIHSSVDLVI